MSTNLVTELNDIARNIRNEPVQRLEEIAKENDLQGQTFEAMRAKLAELMQTLEQTAHYIEDGG